MNKASRILLVYQAKQFTPGIVIGCVAVLIVLSFYLFAPLRTVLDEQGKPVRHGVGTVTNIINRSVTRGNTNPSALISIEVGDSQTVINSHSKFTVGAKLDVNYKIGRNGTLYIDHFVPMRDANSK